MKNLLGVALVEAEAAMLPAELLLPPAASPLCSHLGAASNVTCLLLLELSNGGTCGRQSRQIVLHLISWAPNVENALSALAGFYFFLLEDFSILSPLIIFNINGLFL